MLLLRYPWMCTYFSPQALTAAMSLVFLPSWTYDVVGNLESVSHKEGCFQKIMEGLSHQFPQRP